MNEQRIEMIRTRLTDALSPQSLEIIDESHKHAGHEGAKGGGGHFIVRIVANAFNDKNLVQRHRMVYEALGDAMHKEIHALSIDARSPGE